MPTATQQILKVSDLRIGNILLSPDTNKPVRIELNHLQWIAQGLGFNNKLYEPTPLTPEILEKVGFKKWDNSSNYSKEFDNGNTFQITASGEVFLGGDDSCTGGMGFILDIEHLHQLQNLFHALTGEELNIEQL